MRILMLGPFPDIQGPLPKIVPLLAQGLRDLGCTVSVQPWGRHRDDESLLDKVVGRLADVRRIRGALQRESFDVLVITTSHDWATLSRDIPLLLATRRLCRCAVLQFHGSFADRLVGPGYRLFKRATSWLLRLSDAALVLSAEEQRQWQAFHQPGRFYVVNNPYVAPPLSVPGADRSSFGLPADVPVVLFVGRLIEAKGILDVIDALPDVAGCTPCHLLVVGDGPLAEEVHRRATAAGVARHLTLAGYLRGSQLQAAFACADVFVLPTSWAEGFPLSIVEAMDAGLPIVATGIRGMTDHLQDGVNALLVAPHRPASLATALTRLLRDAGLRARMGEANRAKVRDFAPATVARHYLAVLRDVVAGQKPPAAGVPSSPERVAAAGE